MTRPIFSDARHPLVLAHRGDPVRHPENTLAGFASAIEAGADLVELDVRLTADGAAVVLHDADLARTTDRAGAVREMTLAEVRRARVPGSPEQGVPTLEEVLDLLEGTATGVDVEIKNVPGEGWVDDAVIVRAVRDALRSFGGRALVTSFNLATVDRARDEGLRTGVLTIGAIPAERALEHAAAAGHPVVLPEAPAVLAAGDGFVDAAHEAGVSVVTWTVDDGPTIERLLDLGIDGVATNDPVLGVAIRDARLGEDA